MDRRNNQLTDRNPISSRFEDAFKKHFHFFLQLRKASLLSLFIIETNDKRRPRSNNNKNKYMNRSFC